MYYANKVLDKENKLNFSYYPDSIKSDVSTFAKNAAILLNKNTYKYLKELKDKNTEIIKDIEELKFLYDVADKLIDPKLK